MKSNNCLTRWTTLVLLTIGLQAGAWTDRLWAGPQVEIVVGADAPRLEQFAAEQLSVQLKHLYEAEATTAHQVTGAAPHIILVGSPSTNPAIKSLDQDWPPLSDQGHMLRSVASEEGKSLLIAGGGSPVATLWAVYELGHHFGVRSLLFGDMDPVSGREFSLAGLDDVWEPTLRVRAWMLDYNLPTGTAAWGIEEHQALLRQLAKLKFNRVVLSFRAWQPFASYRFEEIPKKSAALFLRDYRVDGDTAGRGVFRGARLFENPDFIGKMSTQERNEAGIALAQGIIETAHELGMTVGIAVSLLEFPQEFAKFLPGVQPISAGNELAFVPGTAHKPTDPRLIALARTQLRAWTETYPAVDAFYLTMPENLDWSAQAAQSWQRLDARVSLGRELALDKLSEQAAAIRPATGDREAAILPTQLCVVDFLQALLADGNVFRRSDGSAPEIVLTNVHPALSPVIAKTAAPNITALYALGETADRAVQTLETFEADSDQAALSSLVLPLAGDPRGVLPQLSPSAVERIVKHLQAHGTGGYAVHSSVIGELDPAAYYLSRAAFSQDMTADQARKQLVDAVLGDAVLERLTEGWEMIERATKLVARNDHDFDRLGPDMILRHYNINIAENVAEEPPAWWGEAQNLYLGAMNEMYRVNTRARQGGRPVSLYFARRTEFAFHYFTCIAAVRRAAVAKQQNDVEAQFEELVQAFEALDAALTAQAAVARSSSDWGVIALLNEYGYRPLKRELELLEEKLDENP
jgi:hypothetical protein